ncbi:MAG: hypothetical protein COA78_29905 [Blastopirellula sp.]|nr:MAG: hypothetical protein COA78_29905 [Blastopirellula sp.]
MSKKLVSQSALYSLGSLFTSLAGLITFPILTKNLTIEDYGAVGLFTITIGIIASINKLGMQHSIIRFKEDFSDTILLSNIFYPSIIIILISSLIIFLMGFSLGKISESILFTPKAIIIITIIAALESTRSLINSILVSKQLSIPITIFSFSYRVLSLSSIITIILFISNSSHAFIVAVLIADILITLIIIFWCIRNKILTSFRPKTFELSIFLSVIAFGLPMLGTEAANMFHAFIDRYLISFYLGQQELGIYSASYNMANIICKTLVGGLAIAIVPIYLKVWNEGGKYKTEKLLTSINSLYLLLTPPIIGGLYLISEPLLNLLATEEYATSHHLLPIIATGVLLFSTNVIFAAGLQIQKKPKRILQFVIESLIINIILNIIFIPRYGITAASVITVLSYLWMSIRLGLEGRKILTTQFNIWLGFRSIIYTLIMVAITMRVDTSSHFTNFIARVTLGGSIFIIFTLVLEPSFRLACSEAIRNRVKYNKS